MRVLKFGGAALSDGPAVRHAARLVREHGGPRPVVVVSAHQGVTELLERAAEGAREGRLEWDPVRIRHRTLLRQLDLPGDLVDRHLRELRGVLEMLRERPAADRRLQDFVLSFGERMSARVVAATLRREGVDATPLDAFDLGLSTGRGRTSGSEPPPPRVAEALAGVPGVPVVTGFLALDDGGHLTTLGPNGSDLSAAWFAEAVGAEEVQLWKDVPGILTADPRLVPEARPLAALGWNEAAELAVHGSVVLHPRALEPASRAGLVVCVRSVSEPERAGTRIAGTTSTPGPVAIAHRPRLMRLLFVPGPGCAGLTPSALFAELAAAGLEPYLVSGSARAGEVLLPEGPDPLPLAEALRLHATLERGWAAATVVGPGVGEDEDLARELAGRLERSGLDARRGPAAGPASLVHRVRAGDLPALVGALHAACFGEDEPGSGTVDGARGSAAATG